jgi:hypothetical protein
MDYPPHSRAGSALALQSGRNLFVALADEATAADEQGGRGAPHRLLVHQLHLALPPRRPPRPAPAARRGGAGADLRARCGLCCGRGQVGFQAARVGGVGLVAQHAVGVSVEQVTRGADAAASHQVEHVEAGGRRRRGGCRLLRPKLQLLRLAGTVVHHCRQRCQISGEAGLGPVKGRAWQGQAVGTGCGAVAAAARCQPVPAHASGISRRSTCSCRSVTSVLLYLNQMKRPSPVAMMGMLCEGWCHQL